MGDLTCVAENIREESFLQPIGVTERLELVFGEHRLKAYKDILKKKGAERQAASESRVVRELLMTSVTKRVDDGEDI